MKTIEFTEREIEDLRKLVSNFNLYYEDDDEWTFNDLEDQRQLAVEIVIILTNKI
jgi:translation elongation factor P/translation initiation factor 5A